MGLDMDTAAIQATVADWLATSWDPNRPLVQWREMLADSGWGCPSWPVEWYGLGLPPQFTKTVEEEFRRVGAVGVADVGIGILLAAPILLQYGSDDLKRRTLRPIVTSTVRWCELFSEPGSGSDLAGLTTRAERDGDEWIVTGQKVWTTGGHRADYGILLARTDWNVPKHRGLTCFALPMHQPGVEVRDLRQMNGYATFCEVFLDGARVDNADMIGEPGAGWGIAKAVLARERAHGTTPAPDFSAIVDPGTTLREAEAEASEHRDTYRWYPQRAGRPDLVIDQARQTGANSDALARQRVADVIARDRLRLWTVERFRANRSASPGPEGSLAKLAATEIARRAASVHASMAGAHAMLTGPDSIAEGVVAEITVSVPAASIAGGTDEIQRNIVSEQLLGLPREPAVDIEIPFSEVRTNT
jgi:alkylation response protein AidB-like acyl-CoA dehydrogenase